MGLLYITDWNPQGSGYFSIGNSFISALTEERDEIIIVLGMNYRGQEYKQTAVTVVPTEFAHITARIKHLLADEELNIDKVAVALDIPVQAQLIVQFPRQQRPFRYIGIFPLDGGPLVQEWAAVVGEMNDAFAISRFAQKCCRDAGLEVNYLPVCVGGWYRHAEPGFREEVRQQHGIEDKFIILTVADNQERKNLSGAMQMVAEFAKRHDNVEYWLVTRVASPIGWQLESLAIELGIRHRTHIFNKTLDPEALHLFYSGADVLLQPSKAEGLGMPILEAQIVGGCIPIATRTSAIVELIERGGGLFIEPEYHFLDPFGNTRRVFPSIEDGVKKLEMIYNTSEDSLEWMREFGRRIIKERYWDKAAKIFWDVMDRKNLGTVGSRSKVPWYAPSYRREAPDFQYEFEYIGN